MYQLRRRPLYYRRPGNLSECAIKFLAAFVGPKLPSGFLEPLGLLFVS
jgi:hypothetical protein